MQVLDASLDSEAKLFLPRAGNCLLRNLGTYCSRLQNTFFCCLLSFSASKSKKEKIKKKENSRRHESSKKG